MVKKKYSVLVVLLFVLAMSLGASQAEANFGKIDRLTGNPPLGGDRAKYERELTLSQPYLELTALAVTDTSASNTGTKILWSVTNASQSGGTATYSFDPDDTTTLDSGGRSKVIVTFKDATASDKFIITAELRPETGPTIGATATVEVTFKQPIPLAGISISQKSMSIRKNDIDASLKVTATPSDASGLDYSWSSDDPSQNIIRFSIPSASPDIATITPVAKGNAVVSVIVKDSQNNSFTESCDITVVDEDELTDNMEIDPVDETSDTSTIIYGVDENYILAITGRNVDAEKIATLSKTSATKDNVKYLHGTGKATVIVEASRSNIAGSSLGIPNYDTTVVSAMRFTSEKFSDIGNMIPIRIAYDLRGLNYPDGTTPIDAPDSIAEFDSNYMVTKYFEKDLSLNLSDYLRNDMNMGTTYLVYDEETNGRFLFAPLIVLVDALPPSSAKKIGTNNKYGVLYDNTNNILFIYDGNPDGYVTDPIVLEKRPVHSGGGGGGGCSAGAGAFALIVLAIAGMRPARGKR